MSTWSLFIDRSDRPYGPTDVRSALTGLDSFGAIGTGVIADNGDFEWRGPLGEMPEDLPERLGSFGVVRSRNLSGTLINEMQPRRSSSGRYSILWSGEIYNRTDLFKWAGTEELSWSELSDADLILQCIEIKGKGFLSLLNAKFAFALFDRIEKDWWLARDRSGAKNLFWGQAQGQLMAGTSIRAILAQGRYKAEVNIEGLWHNLGFPAPPQPITCFKGIWSLGRGQEMTISLNSGEVPQPKTYWSIPIGTQKLEMSLAEAGELIDERLQQAISRQVRDGRGVGSLISGGVDSPYLCALSAKHIPNLPVFTFSLKDERFADMNEDERAGLTAKMYDMNHIVQFFNFEDLYAHFDRVIEIFEQPGINFAPYYFVAQMAREQGVDFLINGLAADEQHGGFHYFKYIDLWHNVRKFPFLTWPIPRGKSKKWEDLKNLTIPGNIDQYYAHAFSAIEDFEKKKLLPNYEGPISLDVITSLYNSQGIDFEDDVEGLLYFMFANVPNHHLYRSEQFSSHFGIEARYPFLDNDMIDLAFQVPSIHKVKGDVRKGALKEAARPHIAPESLDKKKKGLTLPIGSWMNGELSNFTQDKLNSLGSRPEWDGEEIEKLFNTYRHSHPAKIWKLVMVELWYERFIDA